MSEVHLEVTRLTPELITICIAGGTMGTMYTLETCTELPVGSSSAAWTQLQTFWKGEDKACETTHSTVNAARYYRVRRVQ